MKRCKRRRRDYDDRVSIEELEAMIEERRKTMGDVRQGVRPKRKERERKPKADPDRTAGIRPRKW